MTNDGTEPQFYSSGAVSGGYTVLRTPWRKSIFFGGLALAVIVAAAFKLHGSR